MAEVSLPPPERGSPGPSADKVYLVAALPRCLSRRHLPCWWFGQWTRQPVSQPTQVLGSPFEEAETTAVASPCARDNSSAATAAGSRAGVRPRTSLRMT